MLEQKIDALIIAINALRETMEGSKPATVATPEEKKAPKNQEPAKAEALESAKEEPNEINPDALREELQEFCLATVRKDRSKKEKIVKAIAEFGAELIKDVAADKLPELKKALEAL